MEKGYIECLDQLAERTGSVLVIAQTGDWDNLLAILEERSVLIEQINAWLPPPDELDEATASQASSILKRIDTQHQHIMRVLQAALVATKDDLEASGRVRTTVAAYGRSMGTSLHSPTARFMDRQK